MAQRLRKCLRHENEIFSNFEVKCTYMYITDGEQIKQKRKAQDDMEKKAEKKLKPVNHRMIDLE